MFYTVHYQFSQRFPFPLEEVWEWATDYRAGDLALMGFDGKREIERIDRDTLVLNDTFFAEGGTTKKKRLVRFFPELHILTNTRLSSPNTHSQFIYQFVAEGKNRSRLDFTGAQVNRANSRPSPAKVAALAAEYVRVDAPVWVNLAAAMRKDLAAPR